MWVRVRVRVGVRVGVRDRVRVRVGVGVRANLGHRFLPVRGLERDLCLRLGTRRLALRLRALGDLPRLAAVDVIVGLIVPDCPPCAARRRALLEYVPYFAPLRPARHLLVVCTHLVRVRGWGWGEG